jgi:hypothetical protein
MSIPQLEVQRTLSFRKCSFLKRSRLNAPRALSIEYWFATQYPKQQGEVLSSRFAAALKQTLDKIIKSLLSQFRANKGIAAS